MINDKDNLPDHRNKRRYSWPWFVLAAVLLAIVLAILWMSKEVERARRIRELNTPTPRTDRGPKELLTCAVRVPNLHW
jgi:hypothetical protein